VLSHSVKIRLIFVIRAEQAGDLREPTIGTRCGFLLLGEVALLVM
jgi:hypothetical protein